MALASLLPSLVMAQLVEAVDLSGDYVVTAPLACRVTVVQTGTGFQTNGSCDWNGTIVPFTASGTVDPVTGAFSGNGVLGGICAGVLNGTGDGEVLTGTATNVCTPGPPGVLAATKCGNGVIDALENCEDGNLADGDCCSARCRAEPAGAVCSADGASPCGGLCDQAAACTPMPVPPRECRRAVASRDLERCMKTQCRGMSPETCRRRCRPAPIRTLAYAQSECRADPVSRTYVAYQQLRIRRGEREPITVATFESPRVADPLGFCPAWRNVGFGGDSVLAFPLQRLGVSPDGETVVYEVNDAAPFFPFGPLPPESNGIFMVRSDGNGRRRLGPPSGDKSFRLGPSFAFHQPNLDLYGAYTFAPPIAFSPDGRRIAFTEQGPAPDGQQAVQIAVLDLVTGARQVLTRLPAGAEPPAFQDNSYGAPYFLTCCPRFVDDETIAFQTFTDPVNDPQGSRPTDVNALNFFTIRIDGTHLTALPRPTLADGAQVVPAFGVTGRRVDLRRVSVPGEPKGPPVDPPGSRFPITEIFVQYGGRQLVQLTKYDRVDTLLGFLTPNRQRAVFLASADPLGTNPYGNCQLFSVNVRGGGLRQITRLDPGYPVGNPGCFLPEGIGYGVFRAIAQDAVTGTIVFDTTRDALGLGAEAGAPKVDHVFAIRPDGSGLRRLTDGPGATHFPETVGVSVQQVGPYAYSAAPSP